MGDCHADVAISHITSGYCGEVIPQADAELQNQGRILGIQLSVAGNFGADFGVSTDADPNAIRDDDCPPWEE